jgi:hypothetical protein
MSSAGIIYTCAQIENKRTQEKESFNLKLSKDQCGVLAKDETFQRRIAEAFGHAVCQKLGWNRGECRVSILPPFGASHEKYLGVLSKLRSEAVTGITVDVTPIRP